MWLLDVNFLIYAFWSDSPYHETCRRWLETALTEGQPIGLTGLAELGFLRITTQSLGGNPATPLPLAREFLTSLRQSPTVVSIEPDSLHRSIFDRLCDRYNFKGRDLTDTWLAAIAIEAGATLVSADLGFRRILELDHFNPLDPAT